MIFEIVSEGYVNRRRISLLRRRFGYAKGEDAAHLILSFIFIDFGLKRLGSKSERYINAVISLNE